MKSRAIAIALVLASAAAAAAEPRPLAKPDDPLQPGERLGYIVRLPSETPEAREARHRRVAERRAGTPILLHRGAWKFAPENSLEAYAAALDRGADGNEIDFHRTRDGVLCFNHDGAVDRTLKGSGKIKDLTYYELLALRYKDARDADGKFMRIPTFAAVLLLARERAMLLHLDVKVGGLQEEIAKAFDDADMWDHVVEVNGGNAETLRASPKVKLIPYKGWFHEIRDRLDATDGRMIFCEADPTEAVKAIGRRAPEKPEPLPAGLWAAWRAGN